jgi:uncharacterized protein DUF5681
MSENHNDDTDDVGYGHPPKKHQFKKGQSGNPKGRPKGQKNIKTLLAEELTQRVKIKEDGKQKNITKKEGVVKSTVNKAMKGDLKAVGMIFNLEEEQEADLMMKGGDATLSDAEIKALSNEAEFLQRVQVAKDNIQKQREQDDE